MHYANRCRNDTLETFVSQQYIADETGISRTNISRGVRSLVDKGFLKFYPKKGRSNVMKLIIKGEKNVKESRKESRDESNRISESVCESSKCRVASEW